MDPLKCCGCALASLVALAAAIGCGESGDQALPALGGAGGAAPSSPSWGGAPSAPSSGASGATGAKPSCSGEPEHFASEAPWFEFGAGQDFGQKDFPVAIFGAPRGGGLNSGSLDVVSLGQTGEVTVGFANNYIVDGPGADFIVFENPFHPAGQPEGVFAELARVSVSRDGETWLDFPCRSTSYPFEGCAGWRPVLAHAEDNDLDPRDPAAAGGDPFDLDDLGITWARYVRIQDLDDGLNTFDLDAVSIVNAGCE